jgi:hypothetical protein
VQDIELTRQSIAGGLFYWLQRDVEQGATRLVAPQDRGAEARPAMDERPGMIEIDLPGGTRLRADAFVNERALRRVLFVLRAL